MVTPREVAGAVLDPELPVLSIAELGILRDVRVTATGRVVVEITATYTGCPALPAIAADVRESLRRNGFRDVEVRTVWQPPWTSDAITPAGRAKLAAAGIAPPGRKRPVPLTLLPAPEPVECPRCGSPRTVTLSEFGPTACIALRRCPDCGEPFQQVKAI